MDERQVEQSLSRLKQSIEVNRELQQQLRTELVARQQNRKRRRLRWWSAAAALTAAVIALVVFINPLPGPSRVYAASLQVSNQVSFADIGAVNPLGAAEFGGTVYIPVYDKGLYAYDTQGMHLLSKRQLNEVRISPDGTRLAWAEEGTVGIYDIGAKKWTELEKGGGDGLVYYENPAWETDRKLLFVRKEIAPQETHGFETKSSDIMELDLDKGTLRKLAEGSYPSYVSGKNMLVYQKGSGAESTIAARKLSGGEERIIDKGRFPSVSPNGQYVAYVKMEQNRRELKPGVSVLADVDNVWLADTDGISKRVLTANLPMEQQNEQGQANSSGGKPGIPIERVESGMYSYYNPAWSSDSSSIFMIKAKNEEGSQLSLTRIDLTKNVLPAIETVESFERAAIRRDDDFARSLMNNPSAYMSVSNPHRTSYRIAGTGEVNGQEYVDVEEAWSYTAQPYSSVSKIRYFLEKKDGGYRIGKTENLKGGMTVRQMPDGSIAMDNESGSRVLFHPDDIPGDVRPKGEWRVASLAYDSVGNSLFFTIQSFGQTTDVSLVRFDIAKRTFTMAERFSKLGDYRKLGVSNLIVSSDGMFAALDLYAEDASPPQSSVLVYDLKNKTSDVLNDKFTDTAVEGTHSFYMEGDTLHFTMNTAGLELHYSWNAAAKKIMVP